MLEASPVRKVVAIDYNGAAALALAVLGALLAITRFTGQLRRGRHLQ
ncbi:MAG: hypothetical protein R2710_04220 [Acidimicrobiales bacterium]